MKIRGESTKSTPEEWPSGCEVDSKVFGEFELKAEGSFLGRGKHFLGATWLWV